MIRSYNLTERLHVTCSFCPDCELWSFCKLKVTRKMVHPLLFNSETLVLEFLYFPSGGIIYEIAHSTSSLYLVRLEATREKNPIVSFKCTLISNIVFELLCSADFK